MAIFLKECKDDWTDIECGELLVGMATGAVGLPFGVPPAPENPALARLPEQCLGCVSWAGTTSPAVNSRNRTEQLLAEPEIQNFLTQVGAAIRAGVKKQFPEEGPETRAAAAELADALPDNPPPSGCDLCHAGREAQGRCKAETAGGERARSGRGPAFTADCRSFRRLGMADSDIGMVVVLGDDAARSQGGRAEMGPTEPPTESDEEQTGRRQRREERRSLAGRSQRARADPADAPYSGGHD